jgi:predicted transcriptional regulator
LAAFNLCTDSGLTQREVADALGLKSGAAVSYQLKRLSESLKKDVILQRQQQQIVKEIDHLSGFA